MRPHVHVGFFGSTGDLRSGGTPSRQQSFSCNRCSNLIRCRDGFRCYWPFSLASNPPPPLPSVVCRNPYGEMGHYSVLVNVSGTTSHLFVDVRLVQRLCSLRSSMRRNRITLRNCVTCAHRPTRSRSGPRRPRSGARLGEGLFRAGPRSIWIRAGAETHGLVRGTPGQGPGVAALAMVRF